MWTNRIKFAILKYRVLKNEVPMMMMMVLKGEREGETRSRNGKRQKEEKNLFGSLCYKTYFGGKTITH